MGNLSTGRDPTERQVVTWAHETQRSFQNEGVARRVKGCRRWKKEK